MSRTDRMPRRKRPVWIEQEGDDGRWRTLSGPFMTRNAAMNWAAKLGAAVWSHALRMQQAEMPPATITRESVQPVLVGPAKNP